MTTSQSCSSFPTCAVNTPLRTRIISQRPSSIRAWKSCQAPLHGQGNRCSEAPVSPDAVKSGRDAYPNPASTIPNLAQYLADTVIPARPKGFTFNPRNKLSLPLGRNTNPEIYVASIAGHEFRLPNIPTVAELIWWLLRRLELLRQQGIYIGFWPYGSAYFLDLSVLIRGRTTALDFGRRNHQKAIFHPASDQSILVGPALTTAAAEVNRLNDIVNYKPSEATFAH